MTPPDWSPVWLSLGGALVSAVVTLPWGIFWGWVLARREFPGKRLLEVVLTLPLVLPPVLTGYFFLRILGEDTSLGHWLLATFHIRFVPDWKGAVLAAAIVSSPFMIHMVKQAVSRIDPRLEKAARSLGGDPWKVFWTVTLPLAWPSVVTGSFLVFARSMGEFGATLMAAGNITERTQTIPLAIYQRVYPGEESGIWPIAVAAVFFSYAGLWFSLARERQK